MMTVAHSKILRPPLTRNSQMMSLMRRRGRISTVTVAKTKRIMMVMTKKKISMWISKTAATTTTTSKMMISFRSQVVSRLRALGREIRFCW